MRRFSLPVGGKNTGHNVNYVNKKKKAYILKRLWGYLFRFKWLLFTALTLTILSNFLTLLGPRLSGYAIDAIEPGKGAVDFPVVFKYATLMVLLYIVASVMSYFLSILLIKLSRRVVYDMRKDVFNRLASLPVGFFDNHQTGDIISVISYDIDTINTSLSSDLMQICRSVITVVGSFIMMLSISPRLLIVFVVTIPVSAFFSRFMAKKVRPLFRKRSIKLGELNGYVEETISGYKVIKAYNREDIMTERFDQKNKTAVDAYYTADYYSSMTGPTINFINNLSLALISTFGAVLYMGGAISLGNISSFVLYSRRFSGPINEFANIIAELQSAFSAAERVFRLIDEKPEKEDSANAITLHNVKGNVEFQNISFGYDIDKTIIHNFSLSAERGTVVAIVGPTGAGKTTIINLLMRFYDINKGAILVDEASIYKITRNSLRKSFTMVLQDTWLFHGTIFQNIAYGKENATLEEVVDSAKAAKIHNYIMSLPQGYDTVLSDNGVNISKGQKQLLTIARSMLIDSNMLILDEATSNVDTQTERLIQKAMLKLMKGKTCFVIAHRLSTIQNADLILVMRDGNVVEQGTHKNLMERQGFYYELYRSQYEQI